MNHSHILYDSDPHFRIDPITRNIVNASSKKTRLIQHDHNSERFTFEIPRYIEGHDTSSCNVVEIHYLNVESNTKTVKAGVYRVDDLHTLEDDDETVVCSWLVPNNATQFVGQLQFLIRFSCVNEDTGKVEYAWNTAPYIGISISSGIYNIDSQTDNPVPPFNFITTINGQMLKFFVGTKAEYDALSYEEKQGVFAMITNDNTQQEIINAINCIMDGTVTVPKANNANYASRAGSVTNATNADHATNADYATNAGHANSAGFAETADFSDYADEAKIADRVKVSTVTVTKPNKNTYLTLSTSVLSGTYIFRVKARNWDEHHTFIVEHSPNGTQKTVSRSTSCAWQWAETSVMHFYALEVTSESGITFVGMKDLIIGLGTSSVTEDYVTTDIEYSYFKIDKAQIQSQGG